MTAKTPEPPIDRKRAVANLRRIVAFLDAKEAFERKAPLPGTPEFQPPVPPRFTPEEYDEIRACIRAEYPTE